MLHQDGRDTPSIQILKSAATVEKNAKLTGQELSFCFAESVYTHIHACIHTCMCVYVCTDVYNLCDRIRNLHL